MSDSTGGLGDTVHGSAEVNGDDWEVDVQGLGDTWSDGAADGAGVMSSRDLEITRLSPSTVKVKVYVRVRVRVKI